MVGCDQETTKPAAGEDADKRGPHSLATGGAKRQPLWAAVWRLLRWDTEFPYDPAIPLLGVTPQRTENKCPREART